MFTAENYPIPTGKLVSCNEKSRDKNWVAKQPGYIILLNGMIFAWPSFTFSLFGSAKTPLHRPMTQTELSLVGSLSSIGGLISTALAGVLLDRIGRKYCAMIVPVIHVLSWAMIAFAKRVELILVAVFLSGTGGAAFLILQVLICEICQPNIRGAMATGSAVFYFIGFLISYVLGGCVQYKVMIYICLSFAAVGVVLVTFLRESPTYLMKKGFEEDAAKSIAFYRSARLDSEIVYSEMDTLRRSFNPILDHDTVTVQAEEMKLKQADEKDEKIKLSVWQFIKKSKSTRREIIVTFTLGTASVFQGMVVLQIYAEPLFSEAVPAISSTLCCAILAVVMFVAGILAAFLTEAAGRRVLMIYSSLASGFCCIVLGTQIHLHWAPQYMTAVFIYAFSVTYMLGAGTVPSVVVAEVFLPEVKSLVTMVIFLWGWLCNFIILFVFNPLVMSVGLGPVFYLFATICFLSAVFSVAYLPETKGLPVDAIQTVFLKRK